jgi:hypothetical protein
MFKGNSKTIQNELLDCILEVCRAEIAAEISHEAVMSADTIILKGDFGKLIAQTCDGTTVMSEEKGGVQTIIKETYKNAHFIHCYAHQLNLIMEKAAS